MIDLYNVIINDPVYIMIAVILAISVAFSVVKKLFKLVVILIAICVLYIGYLYYTGEEIPKTSDDLIENVSNKAADAVEDLLDIQPISILVEPVEIQDQSHEQFSLV